MSRCNTIPLPFQVSRPPGHHPYSTPLTHHSSSPNSNLPVLSDWSLSTRQPDRAKRLAGRVVEDVKKKHTIVHVPDAAGECVDGGSRPEYRGW
ncbi:hypothetical protein BT67DRAFT_310213 [Trichocladium antarcticum]|uniref:Uncharacterized protein n=1 Tax=Trichocladium antarcticum TaxID=1450529 RepID=A0AAN6UJI9_9PEZI|nr:hypothetical protein BT67DRAFT_310213 [Trichocladium antarcticum]